MQLPDIVLYHADCYDGFGAAWAIEQARLKAKVNKGSIRYVPVQYNKPLPLVDYACDLMYIVDFSFPMEVLDNLSAVAKRIVIIDHHKSAEENLAGLTRFNIGDPGFDALISHQRILAHFDMTQSGAVLTWKHFHQDPVPLMLQYIQDRDLWKWELTDSEAINSVISTVPFSFRQYDRMADEIEHDFPETRSTGQTVLRYRQKLVEEICKPARLARYETKTGKTYMAVVVRSPVLQSEVGHYLCQKFPAADFAIIYSDIPDSPNNVKWSLRSEGSFDITEIAKEFGGGGHRNAGGMVTPAWRMI